MSKYFAKYWILSLLFATTARADFLIKPKPGESVKILTNPGTGYVERFSISPTGAMTFPYTLNLDGGSLSGTISGSPTWSGTHTFSSAVVLPATITMGTNTFTKSGAHNLTLSTTNTTSLTLPVSGTVATTSNKLGDFAATSSAELAGVISNETGSGSLVFATSPTFSGVPALPSGFTIGGGGFYRTGVHNLTFTTTNTTDLTLPTSGTVATTSNKLSDFASTTSAELAGVISNETGTGVLVFGTSPSFTTQISTPKVVFPSAGELTKTGTGVLTLATGTDSSTITKTGTGGLTLATGADTSTITKSGTGGLTLATGSNAVSMTWGGASTLTMPTGTVVVASTSNKLSDFASTTSAELAGVISNETGTGVLVFGTSPSFTTDITTPKVKFTSNGELTKTGTGVLTLATGTDSSTITKTGTGGLTLATGSDTSTITKSGTGGLTLATGSNAVSMTWGGASTLTMPTGTVTVASLSNKISDFASSTSAELAGKISDETGTGVLVFGTSPTFTTKITVPEVENTGNITLDAINASANSTVSVTNSNATYKANLSVEGDITAGALVGRTTSPSSSDIGYSGMTGSWSGTTLTANTDIYINNIASLPSGVYLVYFVGQTSGTTSGTTGIEVEMRVGTTWSGGVTIGGGSVAPFNARDSIITTNPVVVHFSTTSSFSVRLRSNGATNTLYGAVGGVYYIRIA